MFENSHFGSFFASLNVDTLDNYYYPKSGVFFDGRFNFYLTSSDFNENFKEFSVAQGRLGGVLPITEEFSIMFEASTGFKLGVSRVTTFDFVLGGYGFSEFNNLKPFVGYDLIELPKQFC